MTTKHNNDEALKHALSDAVLNMIQKAKSGPKLEQSEVMHALHTSEAAADARL
mgnify:CR=1 FL=1